MKKLFVPLAALILLPVSAFAHSTVAPAAVQPSRYQDFSLSVPTEREVPTTAIRLLIPEGLERVRPFAKQGWKIELVKDDTGEQVREIHWSGGSILPEQKEVFQFTARTPAEEGELVWKAYQTYEGGEVVAWDRDPKSAPEGETVPNPYSVTAVAEAEPALSPQQGSPTPLVLSSLALLLSAAALFLSLKKRA